MTKTVKIQQEEEHQKQKMFLLKKPLTLHSI